MYYNISTKYTIILVIDFAKPYLPSSNHEDLQVDQTFHSFANLSGLMKVNVVYRNRSPQYFVNVVPIFKCYVNAVPPLILTNVQTPSD